MNDIRLDAKLVAAAKRRSDETNTFTASTMQKIRMLAANNHQPQSSHKPERNFIMSFTHAHKLAVGIAAILFISTILFTGYAYAIGSDPISLIKRWVEGDTVKIEYQDRLFEHGVSRTYSDAAITALAEANTVQGLAFRAKNNLQVPKDGVEYVSPPRSMKSATSYQYPYFATITHLDANTVALHKQYIWGDKMNPSHDVDESITVPAVHLRHFVKGEPGAPTVGALVMVFPETSMHHVIGTKNATLETNYFSFALTHDLVSFKQVGITGAIQDSKDQVLFEPSWGGLSNICLNNGADACDLNHFSKQTNQGLFTGGSGYVMNNYNDEAIAFGEGLWSGSAQPADLISRNIMGEIVAIDNSSLTIKTSSGAKWQLAYAKAERDAFAKHYGNELKVGDKLAGQVLESIYNLDNRNIGHQHIMSLERY